MTNMKDLQDDIWTWVNTAFGTAKAISLRVRVTRFFEEACELFQAHALSKEAAQDILNDVYAKPPGEFKQEVGGVGMTLAALCTAHDMDLQTTISVEFRRAVFKTQTIKIKEANKRGVEGYRPVTGSDLDLLEIWSLDVYTENQTEENPRFTFRLKAPNSDQHRDLFYVNRLDTSNYYLTPVDEQDGLVDLLSSRIIGWSGSGPSEVAQKVAVAVESVWRQYNQALDLLTQPYKTLND